MRGNIHDTGVGAPAKQRECQFHAVSGGGRGETGMYRRVGPKLENRTGPWAWGYGGFSLCFTLFDIF